MKKQLIFGLMLFCCLFASGSVDVVVRGGVPTNQAFLRRGTWETAENALVNQEMHQTLPSRNIYQGKYFRVVCTLALENFSGTAAALVAGEVLWGMDGGNDNGFFLELPGTDVRSFGKIEGVQPGVPFRVELVGENGVMRFSVNGKELGTANYDPKQPQEIFLRPHRNRMFVTDFSIEGIPCGDRFATMPPQPAGNPLPLGENAFVTLPYAEQFPAGVCRGRLGTEKFTATVDENGVLEIPHETLQAAYRAQENSFNAKSLKLVLNHETGTGGVFSLIVFDPTRQNDFALGRVRRFNGSTGFTINGKEIGSITGRLSCSAHGNGFQPSASRDFARLGIHGNIVILAPWNFLKNGRFDANGFCREIEHIFSRLLAEDPEGMLMLQFPLFMDFEWLDANPGELIVLDNGKDSLHNAPGRRRQPSYASKEWRRTAGEMLTAAVTALRSSPFADRIGYLRLNYANCGEWNHWGYHENAFVDYSEPMQLAFGNWLKEKYATEEALRKAWDDPTVTFTSKHLVPSRELRLSGGEFFRLGENNLQPVIDYCNFFQTCAADTILHFARIVKEASGRRLLVGAYYGYYFGHFGSNPYHFQDSGHYATGRILRSNDIDFIGGPNPYENRRETFIMNGFSQSARLHGKVWESEGDQRTHYSGKNNQVYGTTDNLSESIAIAKRDFMVYLERGASYYFFDFFQNWYRDPEFLETLRRLTELDTAFRTLPRRDSTKVAMLFSEETIPFLANRSDGAGFRLWTRTMRSEWSRLGLPTDYYLLSDLEKLDVSGYSVVIFVNSFHVDEKTFSLIRRRIARDNRTLIFLYAPGMIDHQGKIDVENAAKLTGFKLKMEPDVPFEQIISPWGNIRHAPLRPRTSITDTDVTVIGRFPDGTAAAAERHFPGYKSIVVCHPAPDAVWLRGLLSREKIPLHASGRSGLDQVNFAGPLIGVYTRAKGVKTLWFHRQAEIVADLFTGEILGEGISQLDFEVPDGAQTRIFFAGSRADYHLFKTK